MPTINPKDIYRHFAPTTRESPRRSAPAVDDLDDIALPKTINKAPDKLTSYVICLYGEKGIGKSSLCAEFPSPLLFQWEPGRRDIAARQVPDYTRKEPPLTWARFKKYMELIAADESIKTVVMDTTDWAWEACERYVCEENGWNDIGEGAYGAGWRLLKKEWAATNNAVSQVMAARDGAVIYVSHARRRETQNLTGDTYDWVVPTCTDKNWDDLKSRCQLAFYYGFNGHDRLLRVRGSDTLWAAVGPENRFMDSKTKQPIYALSAGKNPRDAYKALTDGFANKLIEQDPDADIKAQLEAPIDLPKRKKG